MMQRFFLVLFLSLSATPAFSDVPNDPLGLVKTLPSEYPDHWLIVHDVAFGNMLNGRIMVLDAEQDSLKDQYKGMINASLIASVVVAKTRPEIYAYETYYTRGTRGEAVDLVTIHDKSNLSVIDEIIIPGVKRADMLPSDYTIHLIDDEKYLLLYNLTPATSVSIVDVAKRKLLNEVNTPSCGLIYPTGKRGFSSMCSDASIISYQLDEKGEVASKYKSKPFFDIEKDALFERPVIVDGIAYFPTFQGNVREVDLRGSRAKPGKQWSLLSKEDKKANWRPGGMNLNDADAMGHMYLLMHPEGEEGSHKYPGAEIWVYDVKNKKRVNRIALKMPGLTIEVSEDKAPYLYVTNVEMNIDVYDALSGDYLRTLSNFGQETPLILFSSN